MSQKNCYKSLDKRPHSTVSDDEKPSLEETHVSWTLKGKEDFMGQRWEKMNQNYWHESSYGAKKTTNISADEYVRRTQVQ